jgi:hypothetical protein
VREPWITQLLLPMSCGARVRSDLFGHEPHGIAERVVDLEHVLGNGAKVERRVRLDDRLASLEVCEVANFLGAERLDRARVAHFLSDVREESLVARDHHLRRPAAGLETQQSELDREQ